MDWVDVTKRMPKPHQTVLALCDGNGDIYQARVCYGMHEPFWCGHSKLNFGKILSDHGLKVIRWSPLETQD